MKSTTDFFPSLFESSEPEPVQPTKPATFLPGQRALPEWAVDILANVTVGGIGDSFSVKLNCGQIDPSNYKLVDEVLKNIGGKWVGGKKAHLFPYDPTALIEGVIASGRVPAKNPLDFFPTPSVVIREALDCIYVWTIDAHTRIPDEGEPVFAPGLRILEPSGGAGGIINVLVEDYPLMRGKIDTVEFNPINAARLRTLPGVGEVTEGDFLTWKPTYKNGDDYYGITVMNPPFSYKGNTTAYIDHIMHAWNLMLARRPDKELFLIAITPRGWIDSPYSKKLADFRELVALSTPFPYGGGMVKFGVDSFKESGTSVATVAVCLHHNPRRDAKEWELDIVHHFMLFVDNETALYDRTKTAIQSLRATNNQDERRMIAIDYVRDAEKRGMDQLSRCYPTSPLFISAVIDELLQERRRKMTVLILLLPFLATNPLPSET